MFVINRNKSVRFIRGMSKRDTKNAVSVINCRRFYHVGNFIRGGNKFFEFGNFLGNNIVYYLKSVVQNKLNYNQLKILGHKGNTIKGKFVDKQNKIYIGINTYTSKDSYNVKNKGEKDTFFSKQIDKNNKLSQEYLLISESQLDNNKINKEIDNNFSKNFNKKVEIILNENINKNVVEIDTMKILETTNIERTKWMKDFSKKGEILYKELKDNDINNKIDN